MKFRIVSILMITVMILAMSATACTATLKYGKDVPFDNPVTILDTYFGAMAKADYKTAYGMLSIETRKGFTESQFEELQSLYAQSLYIFKKANNTVAYENMKAVDSIRYSSAYDYTTKSDYLNGLNDKTVTEEMTYYVVAEDNQWKVHLPNSKITYQNFLVYAYTRLGTMYSAGTKVAVDKEKALEYFKIVLGYSKNNSVINTYAALACLDLGKYDEALQFINTAAMKTADDNQKINILCIRAAIYAKTGKIDQANALFDEAQKIEDTLPVDPARADIVANFKAKYLN